MASARHLLQQTSGRGTYLGDLSPHGPGPSSTNSPSPGTGGSAIMAPSEDPSPSAKLYNLTSHFPGWSVVHPPGPGQEGTGGDAGGLPYYPYDGNSGSGVDTAAVASSRDQLSPMTSTTSTLLASTADVLGNVSFSPFDFLCDDNDTFCEFNLTMGKDVDENEHCWLQVLDPPAGHLPRFYRLRKRAGGAVRGEREEPQDGDQLLHLLLGCCRHHGCDFVFSWIVDINHLTFALPSPPPMLLVYAER
ncbi:hypothetical protein C0Q70_12157 [Pomacea canaliculata]|uniref:Uncharacterized protein n=1 Tax=Pomacea canaliculata TaxID=400727 RepID=A0A2T7P0Q7_POMCA|nr:hypothetical protein C0Q70_12157 [Pomacea canaliculata]